MRRWRFLAAVFGLAAGLALISLLFSPRVMGWVPDSPIVSAWGPLSISFNVPLDVASVSDHVSIFPHVDGEFLVSGRDLVFQAAESFAFGQAYSLAIDSGLRAENGLPMLAGWRVEFWVAAPKLVFLREVDGRTNLWAAGDDGGVEQLSDEPYGVWDYSPIPGGRGVLLSAFSGDGSLDLVRLSPEGERVVLLDCGPDDCRDGRWQPAGDLVALERQAAGSASSATEVWLLDSVGGESWPVDGGSVLSEAGFQQVGRYPRWSSDGRYLSYYHPDTRAVVVLDMNGGPPTLIPANMELMGEWSPGEHALAYSELSFGAVDPHGHEEGAGTVITQTQPSLVNHLVITDIDREETVDLSAGLEVSDGRPAWRPDGATLAVGRSSTGAGRQIWLVDLDGTSRALTEDPLVNHTAPVWSPDGRQIAFMRSNLAGETGAAAVWLLDLESGEFGLVEEGAFLPGWLPG
jgi:Tol biopolymer transport system component